MIGTPVLGGLHHVYDWAARRRTGFSCPTGILHGLAAIHVSNPIIPVDFVKITLEESVRAFARGHGLLDARAD